MKSRGNVGAPTDTTRSGNVLARFVSCGRSIPATPRQLPALGLLVGAVLLIGVPVPTAATPSPVTVQVLAGAQAQPVSPAFWGLNVEPAAPFNLSDGANVAATPIAYIRFPGGELGEQFNYTTNEVVSAVSGAMSPANTSIEQFIATCESIHCHSILQLPAEINSSSTAAYFVAYIERTLGFHPDYWEIGEAPGGWTHYDQPWSQWSSTSTNITPEPFAVLVHQYIPAIRVVDPSTPIIALGIAAGVSDLARPWVKDLAQLDGPELAAISLHSYAGRQGTTAASLSDFMASLRGPYSLPNVLVQDAAYIRDACPTCVNLKVFVDEDNAAYGHGTFGPFLSTFNDTLFLAAEATQGLNFHAVNIDWFAYDTHYGGAWQQTAGHLQSQYYLFRDLLTRLGNQTLPTNVTGLPDVFAATTKNASGASDLVVNANTTTSAGLDLSRAGFHGNITEYYWPTGAAAPTTLALAPGAVPILSPLSMALFSAMTPTTGPPSPAFPVDFEESGLAPGTLWSVTLAGVSETSRGSSIGFNESDGKYPFGIGTVSGYDSNVTHGQVAVMGAPVTENVAFTPTPLPGSEYDVRFAESGATSGTQWWLQIDGRNRSTTNASLDVLEPNGTYPFAAFAAGWVPIHGSVVVAGRNVTEPIAFHSIARYPVAFAESGLPSGAAWNVSLGNSARSARTSEIVFDEPNGTYLFSVAAVDGFAISVTRGNVSVHGHSMQVNVTFTPSTCQGCGTVPPPSGPSTFRQAAWLAGGIVVAVATAAVALLVIRRRKRLGPPRRAAPHTEPPDPATEPLDRIGDL
jgi:hypothetical protein